MPVTQKDAQAFLSDLINSGKVKSQSEAQTALAEFINSGGVTDAPEIQIETEVPEGMILPEAPESPSLEPSDVARIETIEDVAGSGEARAQRIESGEDTSILDPLFTKQARAASARGDAFATATAPLNVLGLPARALGKALGKGDLSDAETGVLRDSKSALKDITATAENKLAVRRSLRDNLQKKKDEIEDREDLDPAKKEQMLSLLDEGIEDTKRGELDEQLQGTVNAILDFAMSITEDPLTFLEGPLALIGKGKKVDVAAKIAKGEAKAAVAAGKGAEEIRAVADLGGEEAIGKRIAGDITIVDGKAKFTSESINDDLLRFVEVQEGVATPVKAGITPRTKASGIPTFDNIREIESKFDINTENIIEAKLGTTNPGRLENVIETLAKSNDDKDRIESVLDITGRLSGAVKGDEVRSVIVDINQLVNFDKKIKTRMDKLLLDIKGVLQEKLDNAASNLSPDELKNYNRLLEDGKRIQRVKKGFTDEVIGKGKSTKNLNEPRFNAASDKTRKMIEDAGEKLASGVDKGAFERLKELDEIQGTNWAGKAQDIGWSNQIGLYKTKASLTKTKELGKAAKAATDDVQLLPTWLPNQVINVTLKSLSFLKKVAGKNKVFGDALKQVSKLRNSDPAKLERTAELLISAGITEDLVNQFLDRSSGKRSNP